jgi:hypothetical protein
MNKIKKEEMDLNKICEDIVTQVQYSTSVLAGNDKIEGYIKDIIQKQIINILDPENVYEKGKYYDELGYYIGIVDEYPNGADYFIKNHCFRIPTQGSGIPSKINKVLIREIKK